MASYLVTGATGFIGRRLIERLLDRKGAEILALVRAPSQQRFDEISRSWPGGDRVTPVIGDITSAGVGLSDGIRERLSGLDHIIHLAARYDITARPAINEATNITGTRNVVELANELGAQCFHHVSSVAVAGNHEGLFTEAMFDVGQQFPSPYHATKYGAEDIVRRDCTVPWRVYRPAIVVGDSVTGEMDKIDGPYYFFPVIDRLTRFPRWLPLVAPDLGATNIVPVDYVAAAMDHLVHGRGLDQRTFHLVAPRPQPVVDVFNAFARVARAPRVALGVDRRLVFPAAFAGGVARRLPGAETIEELVFEQAGIPRAVLPHVAFGAVFDSSGTEAALAGADIAAPELDSYADVLWKYWAEHLDRNRHRRLRAGGPLAGRRIVITGASSGIGRATAIRVARQRAVPLLVARRGEALDDVRREIEREGGEAHTYPCDLTNEESVNALIKTLLADHDGVDMIVNNAGRSIRRSVRLSCDRFHDYERTIVLNYFAPVRLVLGLLPHMTARRFGHIVNISTIGVQTNPPRFSAYVASKAALDAFSRVVASETFGDGITFTTVHMPLVRTPMIRPTTMYDAFPAYSPDDAAKMVVKALEARPKEVGTRLGTMAEVMYAVAPKAVDRVLHVAYKTFPDSKAATGAGDDIADEHEATLSQLARNLTRLLPGVHW